MAPHSPKRSARRAEAVACLYAPTDSYVRLKAGMTCAAKRSSYSRITAWGVPTGWPTLTTPRPGTCGYDTFWLAEHPVRSINFAMASLFVNTVAS